MTRALDSLESLYSKRETAENLIIFIKIFQTGPNWTFLYLLNSDIKAGVAYIFQRIIKPHNGKMCQKTISAFRIPIE